MLFGSSRWDPKDKTCFVTGGSQGLGLSLAKILARKGAAKVFVVGRRQNLLDAAVKELEALRQSHNQKFIAFSHDLSTASGSSAALEEACEANGGLTPDAFFLCAGAAKPYFWVENMEEDLVKGMDAAYWVQAWSAHAISKKLVQQKRTGKICFVSSTLALMSFVGWSSYAPGKHALKGLAETLRSELLLYDISVHIYFAPTMDSPGFEEEQRSTPAITKIIEKDDIILDTDTAAQIFLRGVQRGDHHISGNLITRIFRASSRGSVPSPSPFVDWILDGISWIAIPIWRMMTDSTIKSHRKEHAEYLAERAPRSE